MQECPQSDIHSSCDTVQNYLTYKEPGNLDPTSEEKAINRYQPFWDKPNDGNISIGLNIWIKAYIVRLDKKKDPAICCL